METEVGSSCDSFKVEVGSECRKRKWKVKAEEEVGSGAVTGGVRWEVRVILEVVNTGLSWKLKVS
jgi:hypothetical protein